MLFDKWAKHFTAEQFSVPLQFAGDVLTWCEEVCTFLAQDECASELLRVPAGPIFVAGHLVGGTIGSALASVFHEMPLPPFPTQQPPPCDEPAWVLPSRTFKPSSSCKASPLKTSGPKYFSRAVFDDADHVVSSLDTLEASPSPRPRKSTIPKPRPRQARKKQVQEWKALLHILEAAPVMDMPAKEADLLQWIEDFGEQYETGSLAEWTLNRICQLLEQSKDDTLGVIEAVDAVLAGFCKKGSDSQRLLIGQANITTYRSEIRTWLVDRDESFWLLQETHVTESDTRALVNKFQSVGKQAWAGPAAPTQGGSSGGLLTLATGKAFLLDGKGFVSVSIRFRGWDLLLVNLYLQSGVGPTGGVNPEILIGGWLRSLAKPARPGWFLVIGIALLMNSYDLDTLPWLRAGWRCRQAPQSIRGELWIMR